LNTLITAANSTQAYQLKNKLNSTDIILGDYLDLPAFMLASSKMIKLPNPTSVSYAHEMLALCLDHQINKIYAIRQEEQKALRTAEQLFKEYGIVLITSQ
jgi:hypothetical protein